MLLKENFDVQVLTEGRGKERRTWLEGIFLQGGIQNRNKRIYGIDTLVRECATFNKEKIATNKSWGELGHSPGAGIDLSRVSHRITELRQDPTNRGNFIGRCLILDEGCGKIVQALLKDGAILGVSSRGSGSLGPANNEGISEVQNDYVLHTIDIVADPSAPDAYVKSICESLGYNGDFYRHIVAPMVYRPGSLTEAYDELNPVGNGRWLDLFEVHAFKKTPRPQIVWSHSHTNNTPRRRTLILGR